eukprot:14211149-Ditylum_brightwellii.AAC.1
MAPGEQQIIDTGVSVFFPPDHFGTVASRSGLCVKHNTSVLMGTINRDYTEAIKVILRNNGTLSFTVTKKMQVAQLLIQPVATPTLVPTNNELSSLRGEHGIGSTDKAKYVSHPRQLTLATIHESGEEEDEAMISISPPIMESPTTSTKTKQSTNLFIKSSESSVIPIDLSKIFPEDLFEPLSFQVESPKIETIEKSACKTSSYIPQATRDIKEAKAHI